MNFKKFGIVFCCLTLSVGFLGGCATLFKDKKEAVAVSSEPPGAKVYVDGEMMGTTPVRLKLKSNKEYTIEFKKDGYQTRRVQLTNSIEPGWLILDVLGGLIPVIVDASSGNWKTFDDDKIKVVLEAQ